MVFIISIAKTEVSIIAVILLITSGMIFKKKTQMTSVGPVHKEMKIYHRISVLVE